MTGALLLDMDGTLIDSEPIWHEEMRAFARAQRIEWTAEDAHWTTGRPMVEWAERMRERGADGDCASIIAAIAGAVADRVRQDVPWLPGSLALLERIAAAGIPAALVTNASAANADALVGAAPEGSLRFAVSADDVERSKPDPAPYALAVRRLGADASACIAFEDSGSGARSVVAAGARLWFLTTQLTHAPVPAERTFGTLADVDLDELLDELG
ncbi:HAD family hydrolase [Agrococcus carbonis]|uniref:Haloacid dehalogenase superfamily, subfamily IA, variant 3 with third motif having DD or ED n=1 Tax=Agrococcus carbonis TaxID=684552 RepID=A0A1H1L4N4_9MICO|nr:HAD family hydrolase [Agrococcus carbonis]SDR69506.1 haloacid dehalogenase superfamily, subfamily IA, variant 3 with third motif having DD or ED [Agrococcus carbonis]